MRFESVLVALAATSVTASQYAPPASYGGDNSSPAPAPAPPASYGGHQGGQPEQPPYGGEQPPYGGQPSSSPEQPPYGGQPAPIPSPPCTEGHATETPGYPMPPYGSETEAPVPSPTDDCSEGPAPTETPCLGYDCPKPNGGGDYTTYTTEITSSAPCYGGEECAPVTITSTIIEPCPTAPVTTTTYVTKPCPSCEEETLTSTITVTETAPGYPQGTPEAPAPAPPAGTPAAPAPAPPAGTPAAPAPAPPATTPEGSSPEGTPSCPGGYNCPAEGPSTLVPQPAYTPTPGCNGADCAAPGNGSSAGNSSSPYAPGPVVGSASRFGGSVVASIAVFAAAAFML